MNPVAKRVVPVPVRRLLAKLRFDWRNRGFTPYVKRKTIEGVEFDFWIGDADGRDWYDIGCSDPVWPEMRFVRDHIVRHGDVVVECGAHHGLGRPGK